MVVHIKKLSVGTDSVETLMAWQETQRIIYHGQEVIARTTRNRPKQEKDILSGGSIYWIINRRIQCRQRIVGLEQDIDEEGRKYCIFLLDPEMVRTQAMSHKPFQGWRYLSATDAPKDIGPARLGANDDSPPDDMAGDLKAAGLIY